jgi:hypothetical protein
MTHVRGRSVLEDLRPLTASGTSLRIDQGLRSAAVVSAFRPEARAVVAQPVAIDEIHWSGPYANPPSKYGWNFGERLRTYQDPSARWVESR